MDNCKRCGNPNAYGDTGLCRDCERLYDHQRWLIGVRADRFHNKVELWRHRAYDRLHKEFFGREVS